MKIKKISTLRRRIGALLHVTFFITMISSIFWLPWYGILLIFLSLRLQDKIWGGCVLTYIEFGTLKRQWLKNHYERIIGVSPKYFALLVDWIFPLTLVILAYLIQNK